MKHKSKEKHGMHHGHHGHHLSHAESEKMLRAKSHHSHHGHSMHHGHHETPHHSHHSIGDHSYHTHGDTRRIHPKDHGDTHEMSLDHSNAYNQYAIPGFDIDPIGEQTRNSRLARAGDLPCAMYQMSNGSMDYLEANADIAGDSAKKISRSREKVYE